MTVQTAKIPIGDNRRIEEESRTSELEVGSVLWDRYVVTGALGSGELGDLWRCTDRETGGEVCLRRLPTDLRRLKPLMAVLHTGIRRIADQTHPHLAAVRQIIYVGDQVYLVGDYAPGTDLGNWIRSGPEGRRSLEEALPVLRQVAEALDFAHGKRIIHRNLKPTNVFLGPDDVVRVTDFGLAPHHHLTFHHGMAMRTGTTGAYQAPELKRGEAPDSASDQYALAVLAWEVLTGQQPKEKGIGSGEVDLPNHVRLALRRAMSSKPRSRFVTCVDLVRALGGERVGGHRGRSAVEKRRIIQAVLLAAAAACAGAALWYGGKAVSAWLDAPRPVAEPDNEPEAPSPAVDAREVEEPDHALPERLVATTPMPVEGRPWVAHTVPMEFVWVPQMGMWVGRYEVVNEEYAKMDSAHDSGDFRGVCLKGGRQPVVRVNFDDTIAFAAWLTEQERAAGKLPEGWRYRLPSRLEAITYTRTGKASTYPWGEMLPPSRGNYGDSSLHAAFEDLSCIAEYQDGFVVTAPVEYSGENPWGLFGAGGNVWETTAKEPGSPQFGGWQGGGWDDHQPVRLKTDTLYGFLGNARGAVNGFRLVLAPVSGEAPPPSAAPVSSPP